MIVGDDVAIGGDEEAGALRFGVAARATAELVALAARPSWKRWKKRSLGEPGGKSGKPNASSPSSLRLAIMLALTRTDTTAGFTFSTTSPKEGIGCVAETS